MKTANKIRHQDFLVCEYRLASKDEGCVADDDVQCDGKCMVRAGAAKPLRYAGLVVDDWCLKTESPVVIMRMFLQSFKKTYGGYSGI